MPPCVGHGLGDRWGCCSLAGLRQCLRWPMLGLRRSGLVRRVTCSARARLRIGIAADIGAAELRRRPGLFARAGAGPDRLQRAERLEARQPERRRRSRRLVGALSRPEARDAAARSRDLQSDRRGVRRGLRGSPRHHPRGAIRACFRSRPRSYGVTRTRTGALAGTTGGSAVGFGLGTRYVTQYSAPISGSWDLDVWGKVRRTSRPTPRRRRRAQPISTTPSCRRRRSLPPPISICAPRTPCAICSSAPPPNIARHYRSHPNKANAGYGPPGTTGTTSADVALAQSQVLAIEAQSLTVGVQRAQFEHAIAILIGRPPAELTIAPHSVARRHSENSGRGALVAARAAPRYRRGGTHHAAGQRADRRRRGRLFPGHLAVQP